MKIGDRVTIKDGSYAFRLDAFERYPHIGRCKDVFEVPEINNLHKHIHVDHLHETPIHDIVIKNTSNGRRYLHSEAFVEIVDTGKTESEKGGNNMDKDCDTKSASKAKLKKDIGLLKKAEEKYEDIIYRDGVDKGPKNCSLCSEYRKDCINRVDCTGCPIGNCCTPIDHEVWIDHVRTHKEYNRIVGSKTVCPECITLALGVLQKITDIRVKLEGELEELEKVEGERTFKCGDRFVIERAGNKATLILANSYTRGKIGLIIIENELKNSTSIPHTVGNVWNDAWIEVDNPEKVPLSKIQTISTYNITPLEANK